jgi:hypothetical protein
MSFALQVRVSMASIISLESASRTPGFQATILTTVARLSRDLGDVRDRQRVVTPFTRTVVGPVMRTPANGDASACAAAKDYGKNDVVARACPVNRLRGSQAVCVVLDPDLAAERSAQILLNRTAKQPGGTRAFAKTRLWFE